MSEVQQHLNYHHYHHKSQQKQHLKPITIIESCSSQPKPVITLDSPPKNIAPAAMWSGPNEEERKLLREFRLLIPEYRKSPRASCSPTVTTNSNSIDAKQSSNSSNHIVLHPLNLRISPSKNSSNSPHHDNHQNQNQDHHNNLKKSKTTYRLDPEELAKLIDSLNNFCYIKLNNPNSDQQTSDIKTTDVSTEPFIFKTVDYIKRLSIKKKAIKKSKTKKSKSKPPRHRTDVL